MRGIRPAAITCRLSIAHGSLPANRRLGGGQQKQKQGRPQPLPLLAKPPRWHGGGDGGRLFESDDPLPGILRRHRAGQRFSKNKQTKKKTRPNRSRETSREKKYSVKYPAGDVRSCESLFHPWWRGRQGAWWHSRRPVAFKECGKWQRRVKEPQSGREVGRGGSGGGGRDCEGVSLETQAGNPTPP